MGPIWDPSGQRAYGLTHPMPNLVAPPIWVPYRHVCWDIELKETAKALSLRYHPCWLSGQYMY